MIRSSDYDFVSVRSFSQANTQMMSLGAPICAVQAVQKVPEDPPQSRWFLLVGGVGDGVVCFLVCLPCYHFFCLFGGVLFILTCFLFAPWWLCSPAPFAGSSGHGICRLESRQPGAPGLGSEGSTERPAAQVSTTATEDDTELDSISSEVGGLVEWPGGMFFFWTFWFSLGNLCLVFLFFGCFIIY